MDVESVAGSIDSRSDTSSRSTSSRRRKRRQTHKEKNHLDNESKSMCRKNKTASNHFKRFILKKDSYKTFIDVENIPADTDCQFLIRMLGEFSAWIMEPGNTKITRWDAHRQIVSALYNLLKLRFRGLIEYSDQATKLYGNIETIYTENLGANDSLVDNAILPTESDFKYIMRKLVERGDRVSKVARGVFACNVQAAGRVNEVSNT